MTGELATSCCYDDSLRVFGNEPYKFISEAVEQASLVVECFHHEADFHSVMLQIRVSCWLQSSRKGTLKDLPIASGGY